MFEPQGVRPVQNGVEQQKSQHVLPQEPPHAKSRQRAARGRPRRLPHRDGARRQGTKTLLRMAPIGFHVEGVVQGIDGAGHQPEGQKTSEGRAEDLRLPQTEGEEPWSEDKNVLDPLLGAQQGHHMA